MNEPPVDGLAGTVINIYLSGPKGLRSDMASALSSSQDKIRYTKKEANYRRA